MAHKYYLLVSFNNVVVGIKQIPSDISAHHYLRDIFKEEIKNKNHITVVDPLIEEYRYIPTKTGVIGTALICALDSKNEEEADKYIVKRYKEIKNRYISLDEMY